MTELALIVPILPGKTDDVQKLADTLNGPKRKELDKPQKNLKIAKETWFLQRIPQGDFLIVYAERKDVAKSFADLIASKDPFNLWLKDEEKKISGIDLNNPPEGLLPRQLFRYGF
jgi:hypothetical protein